MNRPCSALLTALVVAALSSGTMSVAQPAATTRQASRPSATAAAEASSGQRDAGYVIGAEDTIEVDVLGQSDFKTRARVRADGTIQLPLLGSVPVAGRTTVALADELAAKLRSGGFFAKPIVNVEIASFASRYVIVLGDVGAPGLLPVDRAYRVSEVIARSGGIRESGSDVVIVRPANGPERRLPFEKLATGTTEDDPFVSPGDKVYVPPAEQYFIYGQINAPGAYPLKGEMSLRKAIARAGGLSAAGSEKRIKLFHNGVAQKVDMERILKPGDVLTVGERIF